MLTVKSTINIAGQTVPQIIPVVQGDTGRSILFTLADFTIPQGSTATYYVQKPSGEAVYNAATIDGNTVLVELTAQSIIEAGDNYGQVRITNDGEVVTSFDFILLVKPFRGIDATQSTTEMNIFDKAVEQAEEAIDEAKVEALEEIAEAGSGNIAEEFASTNSYLAGEYTIYNAKLYRFTSNHTGAWSGSDAEEVTVGDELTDLKEETTSLKEDISFTRYTSALGSDLWESGSMGVYNGNKISSTTRIRTKDYLLKNISAISPTAGYKLSLYVWDEAGTYLGAWNGSALVKVASDANWTTSGWSLGVFDWSYRFKVLLAKTDDSTITVEDSDNLIATFATDTSLSMPGMSADAEAVRTMYTALRNVSMKYNGSLPNNNLETAASELTLGSYAARKTADSVGFPDDMISGRYCTVIYYLSINNTPSMRQFAVIDATSGDVWLHVGSYGYKKLSRQPLNGVKWACIGDSLTDPITTRASKKYYDYIYEVTGISFTNLGKSGTGYANDYNGAGKFISRVPSVPDDTEILTIFGGGNDLNTLPIGTATDQTADTVLGNVYLTIQEVFSQKPNVLLGIISPTPWMQYPPYTDGNKMLTFVTELEKLCKMYSIPFLDLYHNSNLRPWDATFRQNYYSKDGGNGTHPDENGNKRFTGQILQFLKQLYYG